MFRPLCVTLAWSALCLGMALLLAGCSSSAKIPATGNFHEYMLNTTVDDESARYFLENYLPGKTANPALHERIAQLRQSIGTAVPDRHQLQKVAVDFSVDFAALFFAHQLLSQPGHDALQAEFLANLRKVQSGTAVYPHQDTLIMLVPGFDYAANGPKTGADFAQPRKLLGEAGYEVNFVAINPLGGVEENAAFLAAEIRRHPGRRIAIAGASSAGPAIHLALGKLLTPEELVGVKAWLNLGGILQGSPVLDQVASGPKGWIFSAVLWFKNWPRASFDTMCPTVSRERAEGLKTPEHIAIYNYLGLSLSGNISDFARDKYGMMHHLGPNDGLTLLPDIVAPHSLTVLSPTTDHFFAEDPAINQKTLALLLTIMERMKD